MIFLISNTNSIRYTQKVSGSNIFFVKWRKRDTYLGIYIIECLRSLWEVSIIRIKTFFRVYLFVWTQFKLTVISVLTCIRALWWVLPRQLTPSFTLRTTRGNVGFLGESAVCSFPYRSTISVTVEQFRWPCTRWAHTLSLGRWRTNTGTRIAQTERNWGACQSESGWEVRRGVAHRWIKSENKLHHRCRRGSEVRIAAQVSNNRAYIYRFRVGILLGVRGCALTIRNHVTLLSWMGRGSRNHYDLSLGARRGQSILGRGCLGMYECRNLLYNYN